jgi:superfamily II DNA or RNA helicase
MPLFSKHDEVELIINPAIRGIIDRVLPISNGDQYYNVRYTENGSGLQMHIESDLRAVEGSLDPWSNLVHGRFYTFKDYVLNAVLHKIENTVENSISGLKASKTLFKPHQFIPLVKFLRSDNRRILIADEVGLGKTIEAGHILQELFARREINRVLVVCTKTLQDKWRMEMQDKFAFPFEEVTGAGLMKAFSGTVPPEQFFGVINYDKFSANAELISFAKKHQLQFDLIILDEVQMIRNRTTERYKALDPVIQEAGAVVFLSATPINNKLEDLYNLLRLLDPKRYVDSRNFENDQSLNRPIVHALNRLAANAPMSEISADLRSFEVERQFEYGKATKKELVPLIHMMQGVPLFERVLERLESGDESRENRILVQRDLADLNTMSNLLTRTRKRDVEEKSPIREARKISVFYQSEEHERFEKALDDLIFQYARLDEDGEIIAQNSIAFLQKSRQLASSLHASQNLDPREVPDSKFNGLHQILSEVVVGSGRKLVVFAEYKDTLKYLNHRLASDGFKAVMITGDNPSQRTDFIEQFRSNSEVQVLLASKVGTEGIDLQFCDAMVNYDLPWNPMIVEQRIGRLDRIGQESEKIYLYNLVTAGTVEELVYDKLLTKIKIFESSIGALEVILDTDQSEDLDFDKLELKLYGKKLSSEQKEKLVDQKATALITRRLDLERIEKELTDAMVQDMYFKNEIDRIVRNERYLTPLDIRQFVLGYIQSMFPQVNVMTEKDATPTSLVLSIPRPVSQSIIDTMRAALDSTTPAHKLQLNVMFRDLMGALVNDGPLRLEFDQEVAFHNPSRLFVGAFHPLVYAATLHFKALGLERYNAFYLAISADKVLNMGINHGSYALAICELGVTRHWKGRPKTHRIALPIALDLNVDGFGTLDFDTSELLWKESHRMSSSYPYGDALPEEVADALQDAIHVQLIQRRDALIAEESIRLESSRQQELIRLKEHFEWQIESRWKAIAEMEQALRQLAHQAPSREAQGFRLSIQKLQKEIGLMEEDYQDRKAAAESSQVSITMKTMMVSLLEVL